MSTKSWAALFTLALLWGLSFLYYDLAIGTEAEPGFGALTVVLIRVGVAAVALAAYMLVRGISFGPWRHNAKHYFVLGIFSGALPFATFAWGQEYINSGAAAVINAFTPIPTLMVAAAWGQERVTLLKLTGLLMGIGGVALLILPSLNSALLEFVGGLVILGAPFCYAIGVSYARRHLNNGSPVQNSAGMLAAATLVMIPLAVGLPLLFPAAPRDFLFGNLIWELPGTLLPWIGALGLWLPATAVAFPLFFWQTRAAGATNTVLVTLLVPFVAVAAGVVLLQERFTALFFISALWIALSLVTIDGRLPLYLRDRLATWVPQK